MSTHRDSYIIPAPPALVFDLVADVERYPEFLPLWLDARIYRHRDETTYFTEQEVGLGLLRQRFRTKTVMARPTSIEVTSHDGLFRNFNILWTFAGAEAEKKDACRVDIALTWEVHSALLQRGIDLALPETARSMVRAFDRRARQAIA